MGGKHGKARSQQPFQGGGVGGWAGVALYILRYVNAPQITLGKLEEKLARKLG